ncbi:response regulator [Ramlibacter sp. USB13]|uniref:histidine kinase n=1 Tax=Ramlibacter cellulosilyticus TaxID=2764187 RepID=A0A923MMZ0_9BURK|nr:ATP-binding protein [Ramlibacter cellulosilyticus]MBC5782612.1 response regulator [Ramlibacter cellulosilyticus]
MQLPPAPVLLDVDSTRMAQVFSNLLNNAAKYTPAGGRITLEAHAQGEQMLRVVVADDGVGIPADMLERVFELFTQVGGALQHAQGGLGIGLSLARRLVELHGGRIHAESAGPGQGSRFVIDLPMVEAQAGTDAGEDAGTRARLGGERQRILVVDDNKDAAETLGMLLELEGHAVRLAHSGGEALELAGRERPDIIFLDIGLPDVDGYQVAMSLRARADLRDAYLVALTGWGAERDRERSRAAGFQLHLTKPVSAEDIAKALARP